MAVTTQLRKEDVVRVDGKVVHVKTPDGHWAPIHCDSKTSADLRGEVLWDVVREWVAEANRRHIDVGA